MNKYKPTSYRNNIIVSVLCILLLLSISVTLWAIFLRGRPEPLSPDYYPQETEPNQRPIGSDGDKLESPDGGGAINVTYSTQILVDLSDAAVTLMYANPVASNQNVAIYIEIGELIITRSDLILPGYAVELLELDKYAAQRLVAGVYNAEIVIKAYDTQSGEKAMVDARGTVVVTVVE